ncbi:MAG: outer membrane beta-barrel protein [bacterium]|nr:outer membrane beta-barrel protein [bacterium]
MRQTVRSAVLVLLIAACSITTFGQTQQTPPAQQTPQKERSFEVNFYVSRTSFSTEGVHFPKGYGGGGGFEAYLFSTPKFAVSMGFTFLHEGSGTSLVRTRYGMVPAHLSRNSAMSTFNFYARPEKSFRPYASLGQGVTTNGITIFGSTQKQNAYGLFVGGGLKQDVGKHYLVGVLAGITTGGRVVSKGFLVNVGRRW